MKADERHKLRTNQLLDFIQDLPAKLKQYRRHLTVAGVIVAVAILIGLVVSYQHSVQAERGWNELNAAKMELERASADQLPIVADRFGQVASVYPNDPPVTGFAYYYKGETYLQDASRTGLTGNPNRYSELLHKAEEAFKLAAEQKYHPFTTAAANLELGNIAKDQLKFADAKKFYEAVRADAKADRGVWELAGQRLAFLPEKPEQIKFAPPPVTTSADVEIPMGNMPNLIRPVAPAPKLPAKANSGEPGKRAGATSRPN